jgi:hypothetical protein
MYHDIPIATAVLMWTASAVSNRCSSAAEVRFQVTCMYAQLTGSKRPIIMLALFPEIYLKKSCHFTHRVVQVQLADSRCS